MKYLGTCRIDEQARLTNARAETIFTLMVARDERSHKDSSTCGGAKIKRKCVVQKRLGAVCTRSRLTDVPPRSQSNYTSSNPTVQLLTFDWEFGEFS